MYRDFKGMSLLVLFLMNSGQLKHLLFYSVQHNIYSVSRLSNKVSWKVVVQNMPSSPQCCITVSSTFSKWQTMFLGAFQKYANHIRLYSVVFKLSNFKSLKIILELRPDLLFYLVYKLIRLYPLSICFVYEFFSVSVFSSF